MRIADCGIANRRIGLDSNLESEKSLSGFKTLIYEKKDDIAYVTLESSRGSKCL